MLEFIVVHKYCGYTMTIQGCNVWDALKNNNLDYKIWMVKSISNAF